MAYTTLAEVKTYGDFTADTSDDALLDVLILHATGIIDTYTNREFDGDSDDEATRYFDPTVDIQGQTLFLDRDLSSILTVTNGDSVAVASSDYVTEPRNDTPYDSITIIGNSGVYWTYTGAHENSIAIAGIWSYCLDANTPEPIKWATKRLVGWLYKQRETDVDLDRPALAGDGTIIMPTRLPADVAQVLETYKRIRIGAA